VKRERPAAVVVLAVLTLLTVPFVLAAGGIALAGAVGPHAAGPLLRTTPLSAVDVARVNLRDRVGGYALFEVLRPGVLLLLAALLLCGGLGLFGLHPWARVLLVAAAGLSLLWHVGALLYEVGVVLPSLETWRQQDHGNYPGGAGSADVLPILLLLATLVFVVQALVSLVVLYTPVVAAAFPGRGRAVPRP
jgi:hypothetical protein